MDKKLAVTTREAAKMLSVSETTVFKLLRQGTLRGVKLGRALRIRTEELHALLERCAA